ncbi:hypothetical protein PVK06_007618 [Gossypium arboreum]|uniref:Uncharacterized protein n=1 Tax=Gossypium arboreum TaxID=29729 RepID=A0ABR0QHU0_GOSAR|nr:hypothetical protein PVK06_007618 [Gossypium arboreum]
MAKTREAIRVVLLLKVVMNHAIVKPVRRYVLVIGPLRYQLNEMSQQHNNMDVEALVDNVRENEEVAARRARASSSSRKRPRVEEGTQSTEDSSGRRLVHSR